MSAPAGVETAGGFEQTVIVDAPGGVADGDRLLAFATSNDFDTVTPPSGWDLVRVDNIGTGTTTWVYEREADGEPADYTWSWNGEHWHFVLVAAWRGFGPVSTHNNRLDAAAATIDLPALAAQPGDVLVALGFHWSSTTKSWPGELTTVANLSRGIIAAYETLPGGGTTTEYTLTAAASGRICATALMLPLLPDPGASRRADYEFFVDWDADGGLALGDFEAGTDGWTGSPEPPPPPETTLATLRSVSSVESAAAGSFTVPLPEGTVAGDLLIAWHSANLGTAAAMTTPTGGATWTQLGSTISGGTGLLHTKVWFKFAGGSEPATYTFEHGTSADSVVSIAAIQSADPAATPVMATAGPTSADPIPTPGVTPVRGDDLELRWAAAQYGAIPTQHTDIYPAAWSVSWYGFGKRSTTRAYQGNSELGDGTGDQYGKIGFNSTLIQADLAGSTIDKVELRMSNEHSWFNSGLTARFGTHNNSTEPAGSTSTDGSFNRQSFSWNKGQTKWVTLSNTIGEELRDNTTKGITIGRTGAGSRSDYGYFRGWNASASQRPQLRITYSTAGQPPVSITRPGGFTQQSNLSSNDFTAGALAARRLDSAGLTGVHGFTATGGYSRAHGVTVAVTAPQAAPATDESPSLTSDGTRSRTGARSLLTEWVDGSDDARRTLTGLIVGRAYTASAWVWVPAGGLAVRLAVQGVASGALSTTVDAWQQISVAFTATATSHVLQLVPASAPTGGEQVWMDVVMVTSAGENITSRVLGLRAAVAFSYGRDQARSLSAIAPGETGFEVNNISRDYTPDNPDSPLSGLLRSGRPVLIRATYDDRIYNLFRGSLDDYELLPDRSTRSVKFTALDALAQLRQGRLSTPVHASLRTGDAIHAVLDALGWPSHARDIDPGATVCRWWAEEGVDGFEAITKLVASEGPPAFAFVNATGDVVFRDRHHRLTRSASQVTQAVFRDSGGEPLFSPPMAYDIGWRDIVNTVTVSVEERAPGPPAEVWADDSVIALASGEEHVIRVETSDAFIRAVPPVQGVRLASADAELLIPADADYVVRSGRVEAALSRTSGRSTEIRLTAVGGAAVIEGIRLRACPITVTRTVQIRAQDAESAGVHGVMSYDGDMPWAGVHDAAAIAQLILGQRSERLPIVHINVINANVSRMTQILSRDLSDRVHVTEAETFTDADFYVEQIEHTIAQVGHEHTATFGLERVREQPTTVFTFDDPDRGFGRGTFGMDGFSDADSLLILDHSRLDEGLLGY